MTMDLHELVRRFQAGESRNAISRAMDLSVNTVTAYRRWANSQNLLTGPLPDLATLERLRQATRTQARQPNESSLEAYRAEVSQLLDSGRKPRAIWTLLQKRHLGLVTSQAAVWRLVQSIGAGQRRPGPALAPRLCARGHRRQLPRQGPPGAWRDRRRPRLVQAGLNGPNV